MIFRQLFDAESCTYSYLLASRPGGEALLIDPVLGRLERYLRLLDELGLKLVKALDTHVHADHITALGALRDRTKCITVMGRQSSVDVVSMRVGDGDSIDIEGIAMTAMYTPGHTDDSYCFSIPGRVFTGDTLLIRGTGRTDFQNGSAHKAYHSIFDKLLTLPDETLVYPGHDYKGDTVSTIGEERAFNPRLQVANADQYADIMDNLNLADPKMMDVAVPANLAIGLAQGEPGGGPFSLGPEQVRDRLGGPDMVLVDLRENNERAQHGVIPGSIHVPYKELDSFIAPGGVLREMAAASGRRLVYYCAFGERSALAVQASRERGLADVGHMVGGIKAWKEIGAPVEG